MEFRPCIDIHNGQVKQIVGGTLKDEGDSANENFVSEQDAVFYASYYKKKQLKGGHIILLNSADSAYYEATKQQALQALRAYPKGLQVGGGINADNAESFLEAGASHVIVTSYVFQDGQIQYDRLKQLSSQIGKEHLVIDLSCRRNGKENLYYIVTDRWQKYTEVVLNSETLDFFADYCDEFLIHAVDVEGKASGIETELVKMMGEWGKKPMTYAGGVHSMDDLSLLRELGRDKVHVTVGSALDLFGGQMRFEEVVEWCRKK